ncbi:MAG: tetratricopeptide repeat protein [Planctomycetes bacterium]|nr:tetratricopeptide repeat protein [Planctomycetota bacterium]
MTDAETAYLFRHALVQHAAYEMQLPSDRARLHELAFHLIEQVLGGRAPEPAPLDSADPPPWQPHPIDAVAFELAEHVRLALAGSPDREVVAAQESCADSGVSPALHMLYLRRAAEHAEMSFHNDRAASLWQQLEVQCTGVARGEVLRRAGILAMHDGRTQDAENHIEKALSEHRAAGSRRFEGLTLANLGSLYQMTGRIEQAERTFDLALVHLRDAGAGARRFEGMALGSMALVYQQTGRLELAERSCSEALAIHREVGNRRAEGIALSNLGGILQQAKRLEQAELRCSEALAIHREVGNRRFEGMALGNLANVNGVSGRLEQAERMYEQALAIQREVGNRRAEGIDLGNLALNLQRTGSLRQAEITYDEALAIHREVGNRRFEGFHLCKKGPMPPRHEAVGGSPRVLVHRGCFPAQAEGHRPDN